MTTWLNYMDGADGGGDIWENDLDALNKACQMAPGCYIALATDAGFHYLGDDSVGEPLVDSAAADGYPYTQLTAPQMVTILTSAGCKVYIDVNDNDGDSNAIADFTSADLDVNGAFKLDPPSSGVTQYSFPKLQAVLSQ